MTITQRVRSQLFVSTANTTAPATIAATCNSVSNSTPALTARAVVATVDFDNVVIRLPPSQTLAGTRKRASRAKLCPLNRHFGLGWSDAEHDRFLRGLELYPTGPWKQVAAFVGSRTTRQVMTHAQKYRQKIQRWARGLQATKHAPVVVAVADTITTTASSSMLQTNSSNNNTATPAYKILPTTSTKSARQQPATAAAAKMAPLDVANMVSPSSTEQLAMLDKFSLLLPYCFNTGDADVEASLPLVPVPTAFSEHQLLNDLCAITSPPTWTSHCFTESLLQFQDPNSSSSSHSNKAATLVDMFFAPWMSPAPETTLWGNAPTDSATASEY